MAPIYLFAISSYLSTGTMMECREQNPTCQVEMRKRDGILESGLRLRNFLILQKYIAKNTTRFK